MKKLLSLSFFVVLFSAAIFAQGAQDFTIVNATGLNIDSLFVSPTTQNEWGEDILGVDVLQNEQECDIKFHPSEEECIWDIRIVDAEGDAVEWTSIDLCKATRITLHWENGQATADIEEGDSASEE